MATEENKEAEAEQKQSAVKNIVHVVEDENSYINSAKERMNDVIETFLRVTVFDRCTCKVCRR